MLGHAHTMGAGFQEWASQERKPENSMEFLWCNLQTYMVPLLPYAIDQRIPKGQLISGRKDIDFTMLWEKGEGHTEKTECGVGDIAVANFGKYNLSHHLFSFGIGNQIELSFSFASLNTAAWSSTQSSIFLSSMLSLRLSSGITEINEKTLFPWGVHRWVEMNNEDPMWCVIQPKYVTRQCWQRKKWLILPGMKASFPNSFL